MSEYSYEGWVLHDEEALHKEIEAAKERKDKAEREIKTLESRLTDIKVERKYGGDIR